MGKSKLSIITGSLEIGWKSLKLLSYKQTDYPRIIFSALAFIAVAFFATWWFNPQHLPHNFSGSAKIFDIILFILLSYIIWHPIVMEVLLWCISSHIKDPIEQKPMLGLKVAFVTTIVPANESLDLLHKCLPAMVATEHEHDTWLLDESNSDKVKEICNQYGVKHYSRFGNSKYNAPDGKFARKTKGGNHNSWYDVHGNDYDIVAQIDTDFVPKPTFLTKTLGYFKDPKVAFVGTPQIYGNIKNSLIARGAAQQQYSFYGSILRGLSGMGTTLLIGANHVIRVAALKDVDHYSAHITEDLLTGMKLHTKGWKSVYLSTALAVGEGPVTWEAYFNQQMRWAYGCMDILFQHSGKLFRKMGFRRTVYYFVLQQHYFSGIAQALSILLLGFYFFAGLNAANVALLPFFTFYSLILLICWLLSIWLQRYHVDPDQESGLLLAGKVINIASWPIYFLAFIAVLRGKRLTYKVTPKGEESVPAENSFHLFMPHIMFGIIAFLGLLSSFFTHRQSITMIFWACSSAFLMLTIPFVQGTANAFSKIQIGFSDFTQYLYDSFTITQTRTNYAELLTSVRGIDSVVYKKQIKQIEASSMQGVIIDCLFLCFVVIASFIFYIRKLGFYTDDWSFLGNFTLSQNKSIVGLFQAATNPNTQMRPLQNLYDAVLYWFFGLYPFGYHLVNATVIYLTPPKTQHYTSSV